MYEPLSSMKLIHFVISENCITQCHEWTYIENTFDAVKRIIEKKIRVGNSVYSVKTALMQTALVKKQ